MTTRTDTYDPILALLADAMELIAAAREEYAAARYEAAAVATTDRLKHLHLPIDIVRSESGIAKFVTKDAQ